MTATTMDQTTPRRTLSYSEAAPRWPKNASAHASCAVEREYTQEHTV